jgi:hypothetical protein
VKQSNIGVGARVELVHRRHAEDLLDRAQHAGGVVLRR